MSKYIYNGSAKTLQGKICYIDTQFVNCTAKIDYMGDEIEDDIKYGVHFDNGANTNVYGRNLQEVSNYYPDDPIIGNTVEVRFLEGFDTSKQYSYSNPLKIPLKKGDIVVVNARGKLKTAEVRFIGDSDDIIKSKPIITRVKIEEFENQLQIAKRKNELKQKMKARLSYLVEKKAIDYYLKHDDELCSINDELKDLEY